MQSPVSHRYVRGLVSASWGGGRVLGRNPQEKRGQPGGREKGENCPYLRPEDNSEVFCDADQKRDMDDGRRDRQNPKGFSETELAESKRQTDGEEKELGDIASC